MATSQAVKTISGEAGSAVTIYRLVTLAADGQMDHVADETEKPAGVAAESVATVGQALPVAIPNGAIVKLEAGAAVAVGAELQAAGTGTGQAITHVSAAGAYKVGTAMTAAGGIGEIIEVQLSVELDEVT